MTQRLVDEELLRQVLDATANLILLFERTREWGCLPMEFVVARASEKALRTALEQPAVEPVNLGAEWAPCMKLPVVVHVRQQRPGEQHVSTREGITPVKPDDLIMRGVSGEEYPIGRAIFEQTYTFDVAEPQARPLGAQQQPQLLTDEEIESLRKDATRYQWLRDGNNDPDSVATLIARDYYGDEWDEAIDTAIKDEQK